LALSDKRGYPLVSTSGSDGREERHSKGGRMGKLGSKNIAILGDSQTWEGKPLRKEGFSTPTWPEGRTSVTEKKHCLVKLYISEPLAYGSQ